MRVIDFFAGAGGTSCGFRAAGHEILGGLDIDSDSAETYRRNFPSAHFLLGDIRAMSPDILDSLVGDRSAGPLLFAGCAPCQPFSRQNRCAGTKDPRRSLLGEFARFVEHWLPEYVFVENVPGMQKPLSRGPLGPFKRTLQKLGYRFDIAVVPALWYGVPQTRERLVLMASRLGPISIPQPTHGPGLKPFATVSDWIGDLPVIKAGETHPLDSDHVAASLSTLNLKRIAHTPEGGDRRSWPEHLWLECHRGHIGHTDVYGRLSWHKSAAGLTTRCISYSNGRFGHPTQDRAISLREAACLQTFPRTYKFFGLLGSRAKQVGNAVPPLMAEAFGQHFQTAHAQALATASLS